MRRGLGVRKVRAHVPDQDVFGPALGAGQAKVLFVLQAVQAREQSGEPRTRAHGRKAVRVRGVLPVVRTGGQPAHARPQRPHRVRAVRVRRLRPAVHADGQPGLAQARPRRLQAVPVQPVPGVVLPTVPVGQAQEKTPRQWISSSFATANS